MATCGCVGFFYLWALLYGGAVCLVVLNHKWYVWKQDDIFNKIHTMSVVVFICLLLIDITEGLAQSLMTILFFCTCCWKNRFKEGDATNLRCIINYNLLAYGKDDIDACYENMFNAFMGNISENVSAVLVSATRDQELRAYELECRDKYRTLISQELQTEGRAFLEDNFRKIPLNRFENLWEVMEKRYGWWYVNDNLEYICKRLSFEFMCVHRVSRVLKKCGQYQDLMLLNEGHIKAFTYTDYDFYGIYARDGSKDMFVASEDARNIFGREYEYTLVMDGDTEIKPGDLHRLLRIAASKSNRTILQPAIELRVECGDTLFMALESVRQKMAAPYHTVLGMMFNQYGYFGKGLIHNKSYIEKVIGQPGKPFERIPINVLSHDTYEAAILKPLYVPTVSLIEKPPFNYLSWNSRLRRWHLGDMILAMYFFCCIGRSIRCVQKCVQCRRYHRTKLRTPLRMDFRTLYICSISIRSMFVKPIWLTYVVLHATLPDDKLKYPFLPFIVTMGTICIVSRIASVLNKPKLIPFILPELLASTIQFTAEIVVGCVRLVRVFIVLLLERYEWVPQRVVEKEYSTSNVCRVMFLSVKELLIYPMIGGLLAFALIYTGYAELKLDMRAFLYFTVATITFIPIFCFLTSIRCCAGCSKKNNSSSKKYEASVEDANGYARQPNGGTGVSLVSASTMHRRTPRMREAWSISDADSTTSRILTLYQPPGRNTSMPTRLSLPASTISGLDPDPSEVATTASDTVSAMTYEVQKENRLQLNRRDTVTAISKQLPIYKPLYGYNQNDLRVWIEEVGPASQESNDSVRTSNETTVTALTTTDTEQPNLVRQLKLPKYANTSLLFYIPSAIEEAADKRDLDTIWSEDASITGPSDIRAHPSVVTLPEEQVKPPGERRRPDGAFMTDFDGILDDLYGSDSLDSSLSSLDGSMFRPKYPTEFVVSRDSESWTTTPCTSDYSDDDQTIHDGTNSTEVESVEDEYEIQPASTVPSMPADTEKRVPEGSHMFYQGFDSPKRHPLTIETMSDRFTVCSSETRSDWQRIKVARAGSSGSLPSYDFKNKMFEDLLGYNDTVSLPDDLSTYTEFDGRSFDTSAFTDDFYTPFSSLRGFPSYARHLRHHSTSVVTSASDLTSIRSSLTDVNMNDDFFRRFSPMFRFAAAPRKFGSEDLLTSQTNILNGHGGSNRSHRMYNTKRRLFGKVQKRGRVFKQVYLPPNKKPQEEKGKVGLFQYTDSAL